MGLDPAVKLFIEEKLLTAEGDHRDSRPLSEALSVPGITREAIEFLVGPHSRILRIEERLGTQRLELTHDLLTEVVCQQRDLRRQQTREAQEAEARARAERERAERAEAEARHQTQAREAQALLARKWRLWFLGTATALVLAIAAVGYALYQKHDADASKAIAEHKRIEADAAKTDAIEARDQAVRAEQELRAEARRAHQQLLEDQTNIKILADALIHTPEATLWPHDLKEVALAYMGDHDGVIRDASEVLRDNPGHLSARIWRSGEYLQVGKPKEALDDLNEYLKFGPDWVAYENLGIAEAMLGDYNAAIDAFEKAIKNYHSEPAKLLDSEVAQEIQTATHHAWMTYDGIASLRAMRYEIAVLRAFKGDPEFGRSLRDADAVYSKEANSTIPYLIALNWTSWILREKPEPIADYGVFAASGALWERTAAVQPRYYYLALRYYLKFEEAHENPNRKREQYAGLADFVAERLGQKKISGAKPLPADQPAPWEMAWELALQPDFEEMADNPKSAQLLDTAIKELEHERAEQSVERRDLLIGLYLRQAQLRAKAGNSQGTYEDAERVINFDPHFSEAYRLRAGSESDLKVRREDYRQAVEYGPFNDRALQDFADFLEATGDPRSALPLLQRRLQLVAPMPDDYKKIAHLQANLGQRREALDTIEKAVAITSDPDDLSELRQLRSEIEKPDRRARDHNKNH